MRGRWRIARSLAALVIAVSAGVACGNDTPKTLSNKLDVVTAFYPIEFAAKRIGGTFVDVTNLTPPGAEPHDLELKPSDVTSLRSADLVLYFDKGFQPAVDDALKNTPDPTRAVDLLAGLALKAPPPGEEEEISVDPHVWLSPALMQNLVDGIADAIAKELPSNATEIRNNATSLKSELTTLDQEFKTGLASCARKEIFTSHAAFAYLADAYGLNQIPITGISPEAEPSASRLQQIAAQAKAGHATTIFFETLVSPRVSQAVARIVGAKTLVLDPIEGLTPDESGAGADYFSVMRSNLRNLKEALDCKT
ncbi:MAG: metal ABC transporter substrate-binding protein [Actinomycetota bacterium]